MKNSPRRKSRNLPHAALRLYGGLFRRKSTASTVITFAQPDTAQAAPGTPGSGSALPDVSAKPPELPGASASSGSKEAPAGGRININTATLDELDTLPGIGPALAQRIIDHRSEHGPFSTPADIMDVKGIGESKFNAIRDLITTEG